MPTPTAAATSTARVDFMASPFRVPAEPRTRAEIVTGTGVPVEKIMRREDSRSGVLTAACRASGTRTVSASPTAPMPRRSNRARRVLRPSSSPPLQCAGRPAELPGRFIAGQPGQVTQQKGRTQSLGEPLQLLVESLADLLPGQLCFRIGPVAGLRRRLPGAAQPILADPG